MSGFLGGIRNLETDEIAVEAALTSQGLLLTSQLLTGRKSSDRKLDTLFRKVFKALEPGGLLIFDVAEVGLDRDRQPTFTEGDEWACLISFNYDEKRNHLVRQITSFRKLGKSYRRSQERHIVQLYRRNEVADSLREVGFRVRSVRRFGSYRLLPARLGFIARKP